MRGEKYLVINKQLYKNIEMKTIIDRSQMVQDQN